MQFPLLYLTMNGTRDELHPPHLIHVATLPSESQNAENVTLQWEITKENCIECVTARLYQSGPGSSCALNLLILVLYSNACI